MLSVFSRVVGLAVLFVMLAGPAATQSIDLNGDGVRDLLLQHPTTTDVSAWLMNRNGEPTSFVQVSSADEGFRTLPVPTHYRDCHYFFFFPYGERCRDYGGGTDTGPWTIVGDKDLNLDGLSDILLQSQAGNVMGWLMDGEGKPTSTVFVDWVRTRCYYLGESTNPFAQCLFLAEYRVVATADLDGDGVNELIWQGSDGDVSTHLSSHPDTRVAPFSPLQPDTSVVSIWPGAAGGWTVVGAADVNDDTVPDLLLQHSDESVGAWLMNRSGQILDFVSIWSSGTDGWRVVGTTDLNDDGVDDMVLQHAMGTVAGWTMSRDGSPTAFVSLWPYETGLIRVNGVLPPPPTFGTMPNVLGRANTPMTVAIPLLGSAADLSNVVLTAVTSSNTKFVPNANLAFSGSGSNRILTIAPAANQRGTTTITVIARDPYVTVSRSFTFRVPTQIGDFDGDGKTDIAVYRSPDIIMCYVWESSTATGRSYYGSTSGNPGDVPAVGDFNGDGKTDCATYRPSLDTWPGSTSYPTGLTNGIPVPGDYNGDGKDERAVFFPSTGMWHYMAPVNFAGRQWGLSGDIPVPADYDGDGTTDLAVYRPSTGIWYIQNSSDGSASFLQWGLPGGDDVPVVGDYDGDGKADAAVFRPSTGIWYVRNLSTNTASFYQWGLPGDVQVPGDYDGDGLTDVAVFRPSNGFWYVWYVGSGTYGFFQWGENGDIPVRFRSSRAIRIS